MKINVDYLHNTTLRIIIINVIVILVIIVIIFTTILYLINP